MNQYATQLRNIMRAHKLTGSQVAQMVAVHPRTVRLWLAGNNVSRRAPMPYAAIYTIAHKTGDPLPQKLSSP